MTEKIDQAWTEQMKLRVDERIDDETRAAILEGLAQADRGEYVPDEVVAASNKRHGI
jgi:predicted transcriptional regulator